MSEKKVVVPEGMLKAVRKRADGKYWAQVGDEAMLEAALGWWSRNPFVPTREQIDEMFDAGDLRGVLKDEPTWVEWVIAEWQRRVFLAPDPKGRSNMGERID